MCRSNYIRFQSDGTFLTHSSWAVISSIYFSCFFRFDTYAEKFMYATTDAHIHKRINIIFLTFNTQHTHIIDIVRKPLKYLTVFFLSAWFFRWRFFLSIPSYSYSKVLTRQIHENRLKSKIAIDKTLFFDLRLPGKRDMSMVELLLRVTEKERVSERAHKCVIMWEIRNLSNRRNLKSRIIFHRKNARLQHSGLHTQ